MNADRPPCQCRNRHLGGRPRRVRPPSRGDGNARSHRRQDQIREHMADYGPLWAPLRSGHVSSIASLTTAGEKLRHFAESVEARLLVIDPLTAASRRRRERERPRAGLPVELGRMGTQKRLRVALRQSDTQGRVPDFRPHRLEERCPKPLEPRVPVPAESRPSEMTEDRPVLILECVKRT